jgi:RNA polymerase sigma factor (TIGR02999 family)
MSGSEDFTQLLMACRDGDPGALERLVPLVYEDLRRIAHHHLRRGARGQTLDTTGLVHEVYLRLVDQSRVQVEDRSHFLAVSARAMRQVVIGYARRRGAAKRGGGRAPLELDERVHAVEEQAAWLLELDEALERLAAHSPRLAAVVECRFFAGLSEQEAAEALGISLRSVQRDWMRARAWLREDLDASGPG